MTSHIKTALRAWRGWTIGTIFVASFVYGGWSAMNDTGLGGWFNLWQSGGSVGSGGRYSVKLSGLLATAVLMLPTLAAVSLLARLFGTSLDAPTDAPGDTAASPPAPSAVTSALTAPNGGTTMRPMIVMGLALIALGWAAALGAYAWGRYDADVDRTTTYAPLDLDDRRADARAAPSHLSLRGHVLAEHVLAASKKDATGRVETQHWVVPLAHRGWKAGEPVAWLLHVRPGFGIEDVRDRPTGPWHVKDMGPVPRHTIDALEKHGLALGAGVRLVAWVRAADATERRAARSDLSLDGALALGAAATVIGLVFIGLMALGQRRAQTLGAAQAAS